MVQAEVQEFEEEGRVFRATELGSQRTWTKWDLRDDYFALLWRSEPFCISFLLCPDYDTLPSQTNLYRWGMSEDIQVMWGDKDNGAHSSRMQDYSQPGKLQVPR